MNGSTYAGRGDPDAGLSFEWPGDGVVRQVEWTLPSALRNMTSYDYVAIRAGQVTNHPYNSLDATDLDLSVELRDGAGQTKAIRVGAYGSAVADPYMRQFESATFLGYSVEFTTLRVRLQDFLNNNSGLNLSNITKVRLRLGGAMGTTSGRLIVDDLELVRD